MAQIRTKNEPAAPRLRERIGSAIRWWAEHQAWPATEEVRIEWRDRPCRRP
ncbi:MULTISPECIES: hypothetical protein [unclassified Sphingomonas]|uniref:hypothetical protein n=1 Tax=unclassified Sphingomonas TaxID=196159 RepID=UPI000AAAE293|nr:MULTISPECIES: hypothetical protein [unclassified Sphingomonas]